MKKFLTTVAVLSLMCGTLLADKKDKALKDKGGAATSQPKPPAAQPKPPLPQPKQPAAHPKAESKPKLEVKPKPSAPQPKSPVSPPAVEPKNKRPDLPPKGPASQPKADPKLDPKPDPKVKLPDLPRKEPKSQPKLDPKIKVPDGQPKDTSPPPKSLDPKSKLSDLLPKGPATPLKPADPQIPSALNKPQITLPKPPMPKNKAFEKKGGVVKSKPKIIPPGDLAPGVKKSPGPGGVVVIKPKPTPDVDHVHHHHHHGVRPRTNDLIRLFLFTNIAGYRPYGYGGYYGGGYYHDHFHDHPRYVVVPVTPVQPTVPVPSNDLLPPPPRLVVPTPDQFGSLAAPHQRELLLRAIEDLTDDLARVATGDEWREHLHLADLEQSLSEIDGPIEADERDYYRAHADFFDEVAGDPAYRAIASLWGFGTLRVGLREFSLEPAVRIRRAVAMNAEWFAQSLNGVSTGAQWKQHFRLSQLIDRNSAPPPPPEELAIMEPILAKFGKTQADPQYEAIVALPGFAPTQAALADYVQELQLLAAPPPLETKPAPPSTSPTEDVKAESTEAPKPSDTPMGTPN